MKKCCRENVKQALLPLMMVDKTLEAYREFVIGIEEEIKKNEKEDK